MIAIFCGSRSWSDAIAVQDVLHDFVRSGLQCVIHGDASGADTIAGIEAEKMGLQVISVPADWEKLGDKAGPERNSRMLALLLDCERMWRLPVACAAFHESPTLGAGTRDMVNKCMADRVPTRVVISQDLPTTKSQDCSCRMKIAIHPELHYKRGSRLLCNGFATQNSDL